MSREIKFRAWDNKGKVMLDWLAMRQTAFNRDNHQLMYDVFTKRLDVELMQYTGLKDKNGKNIYEGDILELYYDGWLDKTAKVWFHKHKGAFGYGPEVHFTSFDFLSRDIDDPVGAALKVIGNIYENPELLEE